MTDLAVRTQDHDAAEMARLLGMNLNDPRTQAMIAVCRQYDLDPLLKHVVVIPGSGAYITRDGLLHVAHRSGQLDGIVLEKGPTLVDGEWRAVVSVYRKDMSRPFTFPGRYPAQGGNRKYAPEMALKVAECMALRRAFDVSGLGVQEEAGVESPAAREAVERLDATPADDSFYTDPGAEPDRGEAVGSAPDIAEAEVVDEKPRRQKPDGWRIKLYQGLRERFPNDRDAGLRWVSLQIGRAVSSSDDLSSSEVQDVVAIMRGARPEVVEPPEYDPEAVAS